MCSCKKEKITPPVRNITRDLAVIRDQGVGFLKKKKKEKRPGSLIEEMQYVIIRVVIIDGLQSLCSTGLTNVVLWSYDWNAEPVQHKHVYSEELTLLRK